MTGSSQTLKMKLPEKLPASIPICRMTGVDAPSARNRGWEMCN